jgi:hypothetical protein
MVRRGRVLMRMMLRMRGRRKEKREVDREMKCPGMTTGKKKKMKMMIQNLKRRRRNLDIQFKLANSGKFLYLKVTHSLFE